MSGEAHCCYAITDVLSPDGIHFLMRVKFKTADLKERSEGSQLLSALYLRIRDTYAIILYK